MPHPRAYLRTSRTTPLSDPNRLPCGHLRKWRKRNPWCRFCRGSHSHYFRKVSWRDKHPGKIRRQFMRNREWGFSLASRRKKILPKPGTRAARLLAHSRQSRLVRYLLFRVGQGRLTKLPPREAQIVRDFQHSCYNDYCTFKKFAGLTPMSYHQWRKHWYGQNKGWYAKDVAKGIRMDSGG